MTKKSFLEKYMFGSEKVYKKVSVFSGDPDILNTYVCMDPQHWQMNFEFMLQLLMSNQNPNASNH